MPHRHPVNRRHIDEAGFGERLAQRVGSMAGSIRAFGAAVMVVLVWALTGPIFGFSDTWQLVINTGTTIVTFLMAFLIQNSQDRAAVRERLALEHTAENTELLKHLLKENTALTREVHRLVQQRPPRA